MKQAFKKNHQWQIDQDYLASLRDICKSKTATKEQKKEAKKALEFIKKFNDEYYNGSFKKGVKSLHKKSQRKSCYNNVNRQNRDLVSIKGVYSKDKPDSRIVEYNEFEDDLVSGGEAPILQEGKRKRLKAEKDRVLSVNHQENLINELIDLKRESEKKDKQ